MPDTSTFALLVRALLVLPLGLTLARAQTPSASLGVGINSTTNSQAGFNPPDTQGAVGPNHLVEMVNGRYRVYDKSGGAVVNQSLNQFWATTGLQIQSYTFDPRVQYDRTSGRWFATAVDGPDNTNSGIWVGVSNSADPTAGWTKFRIDADPSDTRWADFPTLGISRDWVTVQNNMFGVGNNGASTQVSVLTIPKSSLMAGTTTGSQYLNPPGSTPGFTAHAVTDYDGTADAAYLLSSSWSTGGNSGVRVSRLTGDLNAPTLTRQDILSLGQNFSAPPDADQPGTTTNLASGDGRFSSTPVLVNGKLWSVNGVSSDGLAALRYQRIDPVTNTLEEQGFIPVTSGLHAFYGSIAVNPDGDIVVGFSGSNASTFASAYAIVGRFDGTSVSWGDRYTLASGTAANTTGRFGDYSSTVIDPADPGIFWTSQEFVPGNNQWRVRHQEVIPTRANEFRWALAEAGTFTDGAKWFGGSAPDAATGSVAHAIFSRHSPASYTVNLSGTNTLDRLSVRQTGPGTVTFDLGGGTLNLTNSSQASPSLAVSQFQGTSNVRVTGGTLNTQTTTIASEQLGVGHLTVFGSGTSWTNTGNLFVGGPGGQGSVTVDTGATASIGDTTALYNSDGPANRLNVGSVAAAASFTTGQLTTLGNGSVAPIVTLANPNSQLVVSGPASSAFGGQIVGSGRVVKDGGGTFTLFGGNNTYTGATTVSGGTLAVASAGSIAGTASITVHTAATLDVSAVSGGYTLGSSTAQTLSGSGTVVSGAGGLTVANGSTLRGGLDNGSTADHLTVQGNVTVAAGGRFAADLANLSAGGGTYTRDQLIVSGSGRSLNFVTGGGAFHIPLLNDSLLTFGLPYTIVLATATDGATITENGGSPDFVFKTDFDLSSARFSDFHDVSLVVRDSNLNLTFTPVPEPVTVFALGAAVLGLGAMVRNRRL